MTVAADRITVDDAYVTIARAFEKSRGNEVLTLTGALAWLTQAPEGQALLGALARDYATDDAMQEVARRRRSDDWLHNVQSHGAACKTECEPLYAKKGA